MIGILLLGENWYGSCPRACCYALRLLGCDVLDIDSETAKPPLRMRSSRIPPRRNPLARYAPPSAPLRRCPLQLLSGPHGAGAAPKLSCVSLTTTPSSTPSDIGTVTPASISRYAAWNSMATILKSIVVSNWTNATYASTCLGKLRWYQCSFCYIKYVQLMEI